jgi:hypothetical protein
MNDFQTGPPETKNEHELETPPVQIDDNSEMGTISEVNVPRPETNPTMKVQS